MAELRRYTAAMTPLRALTLACLLAVPALAGAQWMYLDKDGRKVFSDKAPPPETPPGTILRQPGMKKPAADAAQAEAQARTQAENCTRARQMKATYDSGQRIARTNAKGEREILDDAQRASEVKRIDGIIAADCKAAQKPG